MATAVSSSNDRTSLGMALRSIRKEREWSLADMATATGLSVSSLSKIENGQRSLTYDKLVQLAESLSVDISRLFTSGLVRQPVEQFAGRRSVHRGGDGFEIRANVYTYEYLAHDLIGKRFTPVLMDIHARTIDDFEEFVRHDGDELAYVLDGEIELHTEIYAPLRLKAGESVFFDSKVGHAYVNVGDGPARILCVGSEAEAKGGDGVIPFAQDRRKPTK